MCWRLRRLKASQHLFMKNCTCLWIAIPVEDKSPKVEGSSLAVSHSQRSAVCQTRTKPAWVWPRSSRNGASQAWQFLVAEPNLNQCLAGTGVGNTTKQTKQTNQCPHHGQGCHTLDQCAQSPTQPGLELRICQDLGIHSCSGWPLPMPPTSRFTFHSRKNVTVQLESHQRLVSGWSSKIF